MPAERAPRRRFRKGDSVYLPTRAEAGELVCQAYRVEAVYPDRQALHVSRPLGPSRVYREIGCRYVYTTARAAETALRTSELAAAQAQLEELDKQRYALVARISQLDADLKRSTKAPASPRRRTPKKDPT